MLLLHDDLCFIFNLFVKMDSLKRVHFVTETIEKPIESDRIAGAMKITIHVLCQLSKTTPITMRQMCKISGAHETKQSVVKSTPTKYMFCTAIDIVDSHLKSGGNSMEWYACARNNRQTRFSHHITLCKSSILPWLFTSICCHSFMHSFGCIEQSMDFLYANKWNIQAGECCLSSNNT